MLLRLKRESNQAPPVGTAPGLNSRGSYVQLLSQRILSARSLVAWQRYHKKTVTRVTEPSLQGAQASATGTES